MEEVLKEGNWPGELLLEEEGGVLRGKFVVLF